ncbi:MAG: Wzt carbohydrate-binding domain-containing protein, partial [Candidatus Sumerlaeota bacterium]|nr:Wzt carbohydrate-binding domain-containing protein [Candidatus Sumerlaeota bacterium]
EIVAFAEVDKFLDTPVKRFSSGMYVRLAFAVAAHLEPEILIVDEVLAVGDAQFQKKCLGEMGDVAREGRTVLFVSHNMAALASLCQRCLLLSGGRLASAGPTDTVTQTYINSFTNIPALSLRLRTDRQGDGRLRFTDFRVLTRDGQTAGHVAAGAPVSIIIDYESTSPDPLANVSVSVPFYDHSARHLFMCWNRLTGDEFARVPPKGRFRIDIPSLPLTPGRYFTNVYSEVNGILADWVKQAAVIEVTGGDFFGTGFLPPATHGGLLVRHSWTVVSVNGKDQF